MFQLLKLRKRLLRILSPFKLSLSPNIFSISKIFTYTWWIRKKQRVMILYIATQQHSQTSMMTIIRYKSNEKLVKYIKTISSKNKYVKFWLFSFTMLELYNIMQWEKLFLRVIGITKMSFSIFLLKFWYTYLISYRAVFLLGTAITNISLMIKIW